MNVPIQLHSPVRGQWCFMNPSGHHPDAKDFVAVNARGRPYPSWCIVPHLVWRIDVVRCYAWGASIHAPVAGTVVTAIDGYHDRLKLNLLRDLFRGLVHAREHDSEDIEFFVGNHVILEDEQGFYHCFAHLKCGSIVVKLGAKVAAGELLAAIGNSGNTIMPHLHFQVGREADMRRAIPCSFVFDQIAIYERGAWQQKTQYLPRNRERFCVNE